MVSRGDASVAGELCCVMVDGGAADLVIRLSVLLLRDGYIHEAAVLAAAFFSAAKQRWRNTDTAAHLLAEAIAEAVGLGHAVHVAKVTDHMVQDGQNAAVTAIMHKMVASGHGTEAAQVSVAALRMGKVDVLGQVSNDLCGAGHVAVLTNVAAGAAVSSVRLAVGALGEAASQVAMHRPSQLLRRKLSSDSAVKGPVLSDSSTG